MIELLVYLGRHRDVDHVGEALRVVNAASGFLLGSVLLLAVASTWRILKPSGRLFSLGLMGYVTYGVGSSVIAYQDDTPLRWVAYVLPMANLWLIIAIIVVAIEKRQEAVQMAERALLDRERRENERRSR